MDCPILSICCMKAVKKCNGIIGCPNDAVFEVREFSDYISNKNGGKGAVREFIEYIKKEINVNLNMI